MNEFQSPTNRHSNFPVPIALGPFEPDKRLEAVEHALVLLIESRFGLHRPYELLADLRDSPELAPCVFYDVIDGIAVPSYEYVCLHPSVIAAIDEMLLAKLEKSAKAAATAAAPNIPLYPPPTAGRASARGSPD